MSSPPPDLTARRRSPRARAAPLREPASAAARGSTYSAGGSKPRRQVWGGRQPMARQGGPSGWGSAPPFVQRRPSGGRRGASRVGATSTPPPPPPRSSGTTPRPDSSLPALPPTRPSRPSQTRGGASARPRVGARRARRQSRSRRAPDGQRVAIAAARHATPPPSRPWKRDGGVAWGRLRVSGRGAPPRCPPPIR